LTDSGFHIRAVLPRRRWRIAWLLGIGVLVKYFDGMLKVWELDSGRELRTLAGHSAEVNGVAVTADGKRALSASGDNTLKVWKLETGRVLATFTSSASKNRNRGADHSPTEPWPETDMWEITPEKSASRKVSGSEP
jgi:WD40 repeat protein